MSDVHHPLVRSIALASQSPRRRQLLESLGLEVVVVSSDYDENDARINSRDHITEPRDLAREHAIGKAAAAQPNGPPLLVAADTLVVIDGRVLGKPKNAKSAADMLRLLARRTHMVYTGFTVVDRANRKQFDGVESANVTFLPLDDEFIARYVASGEPMDKAGAYAIQGLGSLLVASISGDFYTVMGLPLARIGQTLNSMGYAIF